jgi:hypothetical protein
MLFGQQIETIKSNDFFESYADEEITTTPKNTKIENNLEIDNDDHDTQVTDNEKPVHSKNKTGINDSDLSSDDIIDLNVGGQKITTRRSTLTVVPNSKLALKFTKDNKIQRKSKTKEDIVPYFFDYNPVQFQYLLDQLRAIKRRPQTPAYELNFKAPNVDVPFDFFDMLRELGLTRKLNQIENNKNLIYSFL